MLTQIQSKVNRIQVLSDISRIPENVSSGDGFSNFTADQWQNFFTIYATVVLWEHLSNDDRQILTQFVDQFDKTYRKKIWPEKITPNLLLSLHLCECAQDYGPLYSFWCFSFERINGILGSLPNSNRKIEPELIQRPMNDSRIVSLTAASEVEGLELLPNRSEVGSLSDANQFSSDEMRRLSNNGGFAKLTKRFTLYLRSERFSGELLPPQRQKLIIPADLLDLLVKYYTATYENLSFRNPFADNLDDSIIVLNRVDQYERCRIGSEIFGSDISSRHVKSSFVLARFVNQDGSIDLYPGQVQYFISYSVNLPNGFIEHKLVYIKWYKPVSSAATRFHFSSNDDAETCNVELWDTQFYPICRECIIPVHNIFSRFILFKNKISDRQNS
ncbi:hypothetical protein C2G38_2159603 [Gigaspora rosea]|uniref:Uncharacterized protein n=1 Tax=Gigaspora rosea TaxID=44941 RepID=A0A397VZA3_9GLOM|nr:hypothetical protein C2G38_2159603 [Gigaspora rosea]